MPLTSPRSTASAPPAAARLFTGRRAAPLWRTLFAVTTLVVLTLALTPTVPNVPSFGWDKLNHAAAFTALAFSARFAFPRLAWRDLWIAAGLMSLGGAIEGVQAVVPGRQADAVDLFADAVGLVAGLALAAAIERVARSFGATPVLRP